MIDTRRGKTEIHIYQTPITESPNSERHDLCENETIVKFFLLQFLLSYVALHVFLDP
jgi:hypothetical protein